MMVHSPQKRVTGSTGTLCSLSVNRQPLLGFVESLCKSCCFSFFSFSGFSVSPALLCIPRTFNTNTDNGVWVCVSLRQCACVCVCVHVRACVYASACASPCVCESLTISTPICGQYFIADISKRRLRYDGALVMREQSERMEVEITSGTCWSRNIQYPSNQSYYVTDIIMSLLSSLKKLLWSPLFIVVSLHCFLSVHLTINKPLLF